MVAGLPVPKGIAVGVDSFIDDKLKAEGADQITQFLDPGKLYAVRSSALAEDAEEASWAGQFETFLNTGPQDVVCKIEECHNSAKARAHAYASDKGVNFQIAVVIQEMLKPEYAGVIFTIDPVTGVKMPSTEYVKGLGESLVSGQSDPDRIALDGTDAAPFDVLQLGDLSQKVVELFGTPQDIEWASAQGKVWLVQARPITTKTSVRQGFDLGQAEDLFYWGPSRANPTYMSDFMAAVERLMLQCSQDPGFPSPPQTMVLFYQGKMVWLSNANEFFDWCTKCFEAYIKADRLDQDIANWKVASGKRDKLVDAWYFTEMAEFSMYGAESYITKQLSRFDERTLPKIWGAFSISDKPSFLNALDAELAASRDVKLMAKQYPWIRDGYAGPNDEAGWYFEQRLKAIDENGPVNLEDNQAKRQVMIKEYGLTNAEVEMLTLARSLAEFMDDRKQWMMRTRRLIKDPLGAIENGWHFDDGQVTLLDAKDTADFWQRYIDFKTSEGVVAGIVANTGNRHFVRGEVLVLDSHTDPAADDKILVVPSTSPGWVPLMRHARAMVTDHGGMMSHAAIVAREFNLPCIVGTKQATKVLKTGDTVMLDLVKGEIIR